MPQSHRPANWIIARTTLTAILFFASYNIFSPYLTAYLLGKGFSKVDISFITAFSYLSLIILSVIFGRISDLVGRKRMINLSFVLLIFAMIIYLLMNKNYLLLILAMTLTAIAFEIFSSTTLERIEDNIGERIRGRYSGIYESLRSLGVLCGALIGTYIVAFTKLTTIFKLSLLIFSLLLFFGLIVKSGQHKKVTRNDFNFLAEIKEYWSINGLKGVAIVGMAKNFSYLAATTIFVPLLIIQELKANIGYIGLFIAAISLAQLTQFYFGRLCDEKGGAVINLISMFFYSISISLLFFVNSPIMIVVFGLAMGLSLAAWNTSADYFMSKIGEKMHKDGQVTGGYSSFAYLGVLIGLIVSGWLSTIINTRAVFLLYGVVGIISVIIAKKYMLEKEIKPLSQ